MRRAAKGITAIATTLVAVLALAACTAMMLGGSGSGGTRTQPTGATPAPADSATTAAIRQRFTADPAISTVDIEIATRAGHVTLRGTVDTYAIRARAERLAAGVAGVRRVTNEVEVASESGP